jgi:hypothetical protein
MNASLFIGVLGAVLSAVVWILAVQQVRKGNFFSETPWGYVFGSYVWGDAVVIALFWFAVGSMLAANLFSGFTLWILLAFFYLIRSAFEVVYWLNHQATGSHFSPPLIRNTHLTAEQGAILYQLVHFLIVVLSATLIWSLTFVK